jgi:hypothetical protein
MAVPIPPKQPNNRDNPFDKLAKALTDFIKSSDVKQKASDDKTERLFKEMLVYFKLLEKSVNKGTISSKQGKESELNNDKGFLKLIELMTDIDDNFRNTMDKYMSGSKLVAGEKADLAKFIQRLQDSLVSSNEKIGISLEDMISSFKTMLADNKLSEEFRIDILKFLKDYSEEDVALTTELKDLISQSITKNEISDENLVKILIELDNTFDGYLKKEKNATFAPFQKISKQLSGSTIALEDIVGILTKNQRDKEGKRKGFKESIKQSAGEQLSALGGDAINLAFRVAAIEASKHKLTKKAVPIIAGVSGLAGGLATTYLATRGAGNILGDAKKVGGLSLGLGKKAISTGKGLLGKGLGYVAGAGAGVYGLGHGFMEGNKKGGLAQGFREAGAEDLSNVANTLTLGIAGKLGLNKKNILKGGKVGEERLSGLIEPMSNVAGYFMSAKPKQDFNNLQKFIGEQNKKIFGNTLNLGQLLSTWATTNLKGILSNINPNSPENINKRAENKKKIEEEHKKQQAKADFSTENFKANQYTNFIKEFKKNVLGDENKRLRDAVPEPVRKGVKSFGSYIGGETWDAKRGSTKKGELTSLDSYGNLKRQGFQNDKPLVQKQFGLALSKAQDEITKKYGKDSGFTISGALSGINPETGKLSHASKQHGVGTAVDIGNAFGKVSKKDVVAILAKHGITRPNKEGDPIHFEYTGAEKTPSKIKAKSTELAKASQIKSKPSEVSNLPPKKSTENNISTKQATQQNIIASQPAPQQSQRKIKSDNELINLTNAYGVLG